MKPDEIRQLLGGYATGTLTPAEERLLFEAALQDQQLFDGLMQEQSLREALQDTAVRRELIAALEPKPSRWRRWSAGMRWSYPVAGASALAAAAVTVIFIVRQAPQPVQVAAIRNAPPARVEDATRTKAAEPAVAPAPKFATGAASKLPASAPQGNSARGSGAAEKLPNPVPAPALTGGVIGGVIGGVPMAAPPAPQSRVETTAAPRTGSVQTEVDVRSTLETGRKSPFNQPVAATASADTATGAVRGFRVESMKTSDSAVSPVIEFRYAIQRALGTSMQLRIETDSDATVYIFRRAPGGAWAPVTAGGLSLKAGMPVTTPAFQNDASAPESGVIAIVSRVPLASLAGSGPALATAIEQFRGTTSTAIPQAADARGYRATAGRTPMVVPIDIR